MDSSNTRARFKVATLRNPMDGEPKVTTFSIDQFVKNVERAPVSSANYKAYHFQKLEQKRLTAEARFAKEAGDKERAKDFKAEAATYGTFIENTKFGPAIMPFIFKDDVTFKTGSKGWPRRDNTRISHFSLLMLDVESNTSKEELHDVLKDFEYVLWPTITHRPEDPRYRIVLFPSQPLSIADAQSLIFRIDARLPARNDLSKKLQNLDPTCTDVGRLMFLPRWLSNHPEQYSIFHNIGELVSPTSFSVTPEVQATIDARISAVEEHRSAGSTASIARSKIATSGNNPIIVTIDGKDWLNPDAEFETKHGYIRLGDVNGKISGVRCPFHDDVIGSEFIAPNMHTGRPQFICAKCGAFKMAPADTRYADTDDEVATDTAAFSGLITKARSKRPENLRSLMRAPMPPVVENVKHSDIYYFAEPRLPDIKNALPDRGLLFVRSPKGTGKTHALNEIVKSARKEGKSLLLLTHRRSLANNLAGRLRIANYQKLEGGKLEKLMVICINSIATQITAATANYDIIVIDESEQVLRNLLAETLAKDLSDIFVKILLLLQNAQQVICLDADLSSDLSIEVVSLMRNPRGDKQNDDYVGIINEHPIGLNKTIRCLPHRHQLLGEISRAADAGKKIFVASSTARAATVIGEILKSQGKKVLVVTSETSEHPEVIEFQEAPNEHLSQYDVVVASPSLQTGFSIDGPHFNQVFGWFEGVDGITFQDYDQALSRVRQCDDVTVWVEAIRRPPRIDPPEIFIQHALHREMGSKKVLPGEKRSFTEGQRLWGRIEGLINYLTAVWSYQRDKKFKAMKRELGFTIEEIEKNDADVEIGELLWDEFKDAGDDYAASVFNAKILDPDEFLELQRQGNKSATDHLALRRYRIAHAVGQELTLALVAHAIDSDMLATVAKARSLVLDDATTRAHYDIEERKRQHTAFTRVGHRTLEHKLLVEHLCKLTDIDVESYYDRLLAGEEIDVPISVLDQVVDAYDHRQSDFQHFFGLRIQSIERAVAKAKIIAEQEGIEWTPATELEATEKAKQLRRKRVWDGTFKKVGLPLSKAKLGPRGNQVAHYYLDPEDDDIKLFLEVIEKERMTRLGVIKVFSGIKPPTKKV